MAERQGEGRPPAGNRSKLVTVVVVVVVLVVTLVLCCVAVSQFGQLFDIDPRLV